MKCLVLLVAIVALASGQREFPQRRPFQNVRKTVFAQNTANSGAYRGAANGQYKPDNSGAYDANDGKYHPDNSGSYVHSDDKYKHQDDKYKHEADKFGNGGNYNGGNGGFGSGGNGGQYNGGNNNNNNNNNNFDADAGVGFASNPNGGFSSTGNNQGSAVSTAGDVYGKPSRPSQQPSKRPQHPPTVGKLPQQSGFSVENGNQFGNQGNQGSQGSQAFVGASGAGFGNAGDKYDNRNYRILKKVEKVEQDGYHYLYETENGIDAEEQGKLANVGTDEEAMRAHGFYTYTGPDNVVYTVRYTADENGFVPEGTHIPTPPPIPAAILRALEYQRSVGTL